MKLLNVLLLLVGISSSNVLAKVLEPYTAEKLKALQNQSEPVVLEFYAGWCSTCRAQDQAIQEISGETAFSKFHFLKVDYDSEKDLKKSLKVNSQSTLVLFKGTKEIARVSGETDAEELRAFLKK